MSACWSRRSGILNWSNFCALSNGPQYLSPCKKSIQIHFVGTDYDFIFCASVYACPHVDREGSLVSIRQTCLKAQGFTAGPYTCITHLTEGYSSRFMVSSNISLWETQLKKPPNTPITVRTNGFSAACDGRPINWENERDRAPLSAQAGKGQARW